MCMKLEYMCIYCFLIPTDTDIYPCEKLVQSLKDSNNLTNEIYEQLETDFSEYVILDNKRVCKIENIKNVAGGEEDGCWGCKEQFRIMDEEN